MEIHRHYLDYRITVRCPKCEEGVFHASLDELKRRYPGIISRDYTVPGQVTIMYREGYGMDIQDQIKNLGKEIRELIMELLEEEIALNNEAKPIEVRV